MLLCIEIMRVCRTYYVDIKNNSKIIIILTPMINTHSDSTSADILSSIPDIHCLSVCVWLLTSDYIYSDYSQCIKWIIVIFSCVGCVLGPGSVDDGTGILPGPGISGAQRRRTRPSPGERRAETRPRHSRRKGLGNHNGSI